MATNTDQVILQVNLETAFKSWKRIQAVKAELDAEQSKDREYLNQVKDTLVPFLPIGVFMFKQQRFYVIDTKEPDYLRIHRKLNGEIEVDLRVRLWEERQQWERALTLSFPISEFHHITLVKTEPHELSTFENGKYFEFPKLPGMGE